MVRGIMSRLLVAVLATAASVCAQRVGEAVEPNSSPATATVLGLGFEGVGTLATANDSDWFRVTLTVVTDLRIESGPGPGAPVGDTVLTLLDSTGAPLRSNDDGVGCGFHARLYCPNLPPGTYYVAVEPGSAAVANGTYAIDVRGASPLFATAPPVVAEGPENNDPRLGGTATAVVLPARCNGLVTTTGPAGDWDFYRFVLPVAGFVQVRVAATATHPQPPVMDDPILYLFDTATPPNLLAGPFYASQFGVWDTTLDVPLPAGAWQVAIRGWVGSLAGRYYLDLYRSDAAFVTVHPGGCGGRSLDVATATSGPSAPVRVERPTLGTTFALRGSNLGSGGFAFHVVGFASTFVDLTAAGAPGCALEVVFVDTPLQLADAAGETTFLVPIPEQAALVGTGLQSQLAVFDLSNPLGVTLSNRVTAVLGS